MSGAPAIDVVLVNYRGWEALVKTVHHLRGSSSRSVAGWPHGLIRVVDNSEDAEQARCLDRALGSMADVTLQVMPRNMGFAAGCNAAWACSTATYVMLLNPDAMITADGVMGLAMALEDRTAAAAASPRTWWDRPGGWALPSPTPQGPTARVWRAIGSRRNPSGWADAQVRQTLRQMARTEPFAVEMLAGALLMLRRTAVEAAGGLFDPAFFMYFEDAELCTRLRAAGLELLMVPQVDAVHAWQQLPHKAALMASGEAVFLQRQNAAYRLIRHLWPGIESMGCLPGEPSVLAEPGDAARVLGEVSAISPAPSGDPAVVRWGPPQVISPGEWALLEPGRYWARTSRGWVGFDKRLGGLSPS